ncbi:MAG: hypothetical protein QOG43_2748 [Actinomycetota bacterium]|jgi:hypothetical protein|nr:hypothetical protein [Actinomycetota bacterium]
MLVAAALVLAGWVLTNPVGGTPDELNHVLRAEAVGRGDLSGRPNPELAAVDAGVPLPKACCDFDNPARLQWVQRGARVVKVPAVLDFGTCFNRPTGFIARCVEDGRGPVPPERLTTMGTQEPAPYLWAGLATRLAADPVAAVRWARAANAVVMLGLLGLAAWVLWSPAGALAWAGLLAAVTPMVLFVGASPSPSSLEIAGGICFAAALLRLARAPDQPAGTSVWVAVAIGGVALAASRSLGPVWVALDGGLVGALVGPRRLWRTVRAGGARAAGAVVAVMVAGAGTAVWELTRQPRIAFDGRFFVHQLRPSAYDLPRAAAEMVGAFGAVDVALPGAARLAWAVLVGALIAGALAAGTRRQRLVVVATAAAAVTTTVLVSAALLRQNGFEVQGRHVLAFAVLLPLLAGEVVHARHRAGRLPWLRPAVAVGIVAAVAVGVHLVALKTNVDHYARTPDRAAPTASPLPGR